MAYTYSVPERDASVRLVPSRPPLAAAAHLGEPWGAAVDALKANVLAVRAHLVEQVYPEDEPPEDDLALETIDLVGRLDRHDRYLFRLLLAMLYRGATSKARQAVTSPTRPSNGPRPNGPFAHSVRYGTKADHGNGHRGHQAD